MGNDLLITFPDADNKAAFMEWLKAEGFDHFLQSKLNTTAIDCMATYEVGASGLEEEYSAENGFIEFE